MFNKASFAAYGAPTATATAAVYVFPPPPPPPVVTTTTPSATASPTAKNAAPAVLVRWTSLAALSFLVVLFF